MYYKSRLVLFFVNFVFVYGVYVFVYTIVFLIIRINIYIYINQITFVDCLMKE